MVSVSRESDSEIEIRLRRVIKEARLKLYLEDYVFEEFSLGEFGTAVQAGALALIRDEAVWSQLVPCREETDDMFAVFRFHFPVHADNSGFVGWLASHLKRKFGTGVFVTCGQNNADGGIFDYWGVPVALRAPVFDELRALTQP